MVHLIFIIHGHHSSPSELEWVALQFSRRAEEFGTPAQVHLARTLAKGTTEGIGTLAQRVSNELEAVIAQGQPETNCPYHTLSVYGQSLGGIVARYVIGLLWDEHSRTVGGLIPCVFMTNVSPHLGVGLGEGGLVLGRLPRRLIAAVGSFQKPTVKELLVLDSDEGQPLLVRMSQWQGVELPFMQALAAFDVCYLYANVARDHIVAYQSAAIKPQCHPPSMQNGQNVEFLEFDRPAVSTHGERTVEGGSAADHQQIMAAGLTRIGWKEVAMCIPGVLPIAHGSMGGPRLVGFNQLFNGIFSQGQAVAQHQAASLFAHLVTRGNCIVERVIPDLLPRYDSFSCDQYVSTMRPSHLRFVLLPGEYTMEVKRLNSFLKGWTEIGSTLTPIASTSGEETASSLTLPIMRSDKSTPQQVSITVTSQVEMVMIHKVTVWNHMEGRVHIDLRKQAV